MRLGASKCRRGQSYTEFILVLPIFLILIAGIVGFGRLLYVKLAVEAAAWAAGRHAVATLDEDRGVGQAQRAARYTLEGFSLDPDSSEVHVVVWGQWGRGTQVRVHVCYEVDAPGIPLGETVSPGHICARQTMPVSRWQSEW